MGKERSFNEDSDIVEARKLISAAIGTQYYALYHIWMDRREYICYQEQLPGILSLIGDKGDYDTAWKKYIDNYIEPEDQEMMRDFSNLDTLDFRLRKRNSVSQIYRRKNVGWTRGQFIAAKRDDSGKVTNAIYTVVDINSEKELEVARSKALYEANHDPLTGVFNRNGFDKITKALVDKDIQIGLMIIDIDNFKMINDHHGHENGDKILRLAAQCLKTMFRTEDSVFRIGGDEFCVLLMNTDEKAWKVLCDKQQKVHAAMAKEIPDISVTLSAGVCFSASGYTNDLYKCADKALYETKKTGRAGCTMLNRTNNEVSTWHDNLISLQTQNLLAISDTGMFRFESKGIEDKEPELLCGEVAKTIFGFPIDASPKDCFRLWAAGLDKFYLDAIKRSAEMALSGKLIECVYKWNHPKYGPIFIRTGGRGTVDNGAYTIYGYHHNLRGTEIVETDDEKQMLNAMSGIYFCSYYVDLDRNDFIIMKGATGQSKLDIRLDKAQETLRQAVDVLTHPDYRERMLAFTDFNTLSERLANEDHVDCEYLSLGENKWCRASFLPVRRDENGRVTKVMYVVTSLDEQKALDARTSLMNKKSIESLYNNVPGGIVMYEWDGKELHTLHISAFYEKEYGYTLCGKDSDNHRGPDFTRVHPEDLAGYKKAIIKALTETHELHYEYRVWNNTADKYVWTHIDATSEEQKDGTSLVYALYTDITAQKTAEQRLKKSNASIMAALGAADQFSYEYDPVAHTSTCFTDGNNGYALDKVITDYPECFRTNGFMHPDDVEKFIETVHRIDNGEKYAHCDIRANKNGEYRWHSCTFDAYYDTEKDRNEAILTVVDITPQVDARNSYEERLNTLLAAQQEVLSMCTINITQNNFKLVDIKDEMKPFAAGSEMTFENVMRGITDNIVGEDSRIRYKNTFSREALLAEAQKGSMNIEQEVFMKFSDSHYEWIVVAVNMIKNPESGDICGVAYCKSSQIKHMSDELLNMTLQREYMFAAVILKDTDEFYLYYSQNRGFSECKKSFWKTALETTDLRCDPETKKYLQSLFIKENMLKYLDRNNEFSYTYDSYLKNGKRRLELRLRYMDNAHTMILATMRDVTDSSLYMQYKFDSEHDKLTGLYNRNTLFTECRKLLDKYPEERFVMIHGDMKHFHLYNTFFGEDAGDKMLQTVADCLREMDKDYDHGVFGRIEADVFCTFYPYKKEIIEKHVKIFSDLMKNYRSDFLIEPAIGVYEVSDPSMPIESMFTRATIAAKSDKKDLYGLISRFDDQMERKLNDSHQIISEMQNAIDKEQFKVYLQPKYSLGSEEIVGAEALVRWQHPEKGMVSPGAFIPVFEQNGFIAELDKYMWEHVCAIIRSWKEKGIPLYPISVNMSRVSMYSKKTVPFLKSLVQKYGIDPEYLELELTESAYMDEPEELKRMLKELQEYGFKIQMDDFGNGYSSLNTLRDLPVDVLKLDMKFLSITENDSRANVVLSSVVRMSKLLKLPIVAEGVEKREQADYLRSIGCEYVQGFLFARPMPVSDFERLLTDKAEH